MERGGEGAEAYHSALLRVLDRLQLALDEVRPERDFLAALDADADADPAFAAGERVDQLLEGLERRVRKARRCLGDDADKSQSQLQSQPQTDAATPKASSSPRAQSSPPRSPQPPADLEPAMPCIKVRDISKLMDPRLLPIAPPCPTSPCPTSPARKKKAPEVICLDSSESGSDTEPGSGCCKRSAPAKCAEQKTAAPTPPAANNKKKRTPPQSPVQLPIQSPLTEKAGIRDAKFAQECRVCLPRRSVQALLADYLSQRQDAEIRRLTKIPKFSKRTRRQRCPDSHSDSHSHSHSDSHSDSPSPSRSPSHSPSAKRRGKKAPTTMKSSSSSSASDSDSTLNGLDQIAGKDTDMPADLVKEIVSSSSCSSSIAEENNKSKEKEKEKKKGKSKTSETDESAAPSPSVPTKDSPVERVNSDSDSDEDLKRRKAKHRKTRRMCLSDSDETASDSDKKKKAKKHKKHESSSDSDNRKSESEQEEEEEEGEEEEEEDHAKKTKKRRRIKKVDSDGSSNEGDPDSSFTRKQIRKVWTEKSLQESTVAAEKEESERKSRIAERQKLYNQLFSGGGPEAADEKAEKLEKLVLDFDPETKEDLLSMDGALVRHLKPHQGEGVRFMWNACFESLKLAKQTKGSGCILAHCMGLGKTLQVVALVHTLLAHEATTVKRVLVVCPLSTVLNWMDEFDRWLEGIHPDVDVYSIQSQKRNEDRLYTLQQWHRHGGVLVIGYNMFRLMVSPRAKSVSKRVAKGFREALVDPGPDLVICDEGHLLKNEKTSISKAMNELQTLRRIVLTGTPLQNNLKEYYCMVQFVKPNLLGTYREYTNRFVNPITNGQFTDSTPSDVALMRKRSHVLHKMLDGIVQRQDYSVLAPFLPPKHEYVVFLLLSPLQIQLYKKFMADFARKSSNQSNTYVFRDYQALQRICTHPRVLSDKSIEDKNNKLLQESESEGSLKDFIDDGDDSDSSSSDSSHSSKASKASNASKGQSNARRSTRANPLSDDSDDVVMMQDGEWWEEYCKPEDLENIHLGTKVKLLMEILHECEQIGDKVLVFSQSLYSLNVIEYFLAKIDEAHSGQAEGQGEGEVDKEADPLGGHRASWSLGLDYFRLDGSSACENRSAWCKCFNNEDNTRGRLFLISTRAGGLGINLVAANRVIVFDCSWNPSHDVQSIYRVYRFGQKKPCYIYRFVTMNAMEHKLYERQVTKLAISKRVIDEQQIDRHYNQSDLAELYNFDLEPNQEERATPNLPKDRLFADLLQRRPDLIYSYHEHNSLLENKEDEELDEAERKAAWEEYESEKTRVFTNGVPTAFANPNFAGAMQQQQMMTLSQADLVESIRGVILSDNPFMPPDKLEQMVPMMRQQLYATVAAGDMRLYNRLVLYINFLNMTKARATVPIEDLT